MHSLREKLKANKRKFSIEHRLLNITALIGIVLTLVAAVGNYLSGLHPITYIFPLFSALVFIFCYIQSLRYKNYVFLYHFAFSYLILFFIPGFWFINGGSHGGFQYAIFFVLSALIVASPTNEFKFYSLALMLVVALLFFVSYLNPEFVIKYDDRVVETIDLTVGALLSLIAVFFCLKYFKSVYRSAINKVEEQNRQLVKNNQLIKKQSEELKQLNNEKSKLFGIIAHDLKSPFNGIIGLSNMLKGYAEEKDFEKVKQIAILLNSSTQTSYQLTEDLLSWANVQQGHIETDIKDFDILQTVEKAIQSVSTQAQLKNVKINTDNGSFWVRADKNLTKALLINLLTNAIKFSFIEGQIDIQIKTKEQYVEIAIADGGVGMSSEKLNKLFLVDKMQSTKGTNGELGTGLGLLLCKEFVEKQNGTIAVKSALGHGSTFMVSLPKGK